MTYDQALADYQKVGAAHAGDVALMAGFCKHILQTVVGAVSPKLVFEGALASGLTSADLSRLAISDARAVAELQWL